MLDQKLRPQKDYPRSKSFSLSITGRRHTEVGLTRSSRKAVSTQITDSHHLVPATEK